jgi:hypothetical protein
MNIEKNKCKICEKELNENEGYAEIEVDGAYNNFKFKLCPKCDTEDNIFYLFQEYMFL